MGVNNSDIYVQLLRELNAKARYPLANLEYVWNLHTARNCACGEKGLAKPMVKFKSIQKGSKNSYRYSFIDKRVCLEHSDIEYILTSEPVNLLKDLNETSYVSVSNINLTPSHHNLLEIVCKLFTLCPLLAFLSLSFSKFSLTHFKAFYKVLELVEGKNREREPEVNLFQVKFGTMPKFHSVYWGEVDSSICFRSLTSENLQVKFSKAMFCKTSNVKFINFKEKFLLCGDYTCLQILEPKTTSNLTSFPSETSQAASQKLSHSIPHLFITKNTNLDFICVNKYRKKIPLNLKGARWVEVDLYTNQGKVPKSIQNGASKYESIYRFKYSSNLFFRKNLRDLVPFLDKNIVSFDFNWHPGYQINPFMHESMSKRVLDADKGLEDVEHLSYLDLIIYMLRKPTLKHIKISPKIAYRHLTQKRKMELIEGIEKARSWEDLKEMMVEQDQISISPPLYYY